MDQSTTLLWPFSITASQNNLLVTQSKDQNNPLSHERERKREQICAKLAKTQLKLSINTECVPAK